MIETRLFERDELFGRTKLFHFDHAADSFTIETLQDVEPLLEANKRAFNNAGGYTGDWHRVASIPMAIYWELKEKGIADDPKAMARWLNERDNRLFRTMPGQV